MLQELQNIHSPSKLHLNSLPPKNTMPFTDSTNYNHSTSENQDEEAVVLSTIQNVIHTVLQNIEAEVELLRLPQILQRKSTIQMKLPANAFESKLCRNKPIKDSISLDANILNYGQFLTGKIMGCTIIITNRNIQTETISLEFDSSNTYEKATLINEFPRCNSDPSLGISISNSEVAHKCWLMESPENKKLEKMLSFKLEPKASKEVLVILKSPMIKNSQHLFNILLLKRQSDIYISNSNEITGTWSNKFLRVCLHGIVEIPVITCPRIIKSEDIPTIPLAVKKAVSVQRYRIPFKNSGKIEIEIEFSFLKAEHALGIEYFCVPNVMKLGPNNQGILTVLIKNINGKDASNSEEISYKSDGVYVKDPRMLVAKVKNSQIYFSYYIDSVFY